MIYRLKADSRQQIEEAIPFELYRTDQDGNEVFVGATAEYSYVFLTNHDHDYALADLADHRENASEINFGAEVEVLNPESPMHGWV